MEEILHYENVTFKRNGREILKGIGWHINKGENWVLLGLNGSGKPTLLGVTDEDREKADKIIEDFKISYIKNNRFGALSQGEQRRTLLARAFMNEPDLLILDEPCSGLDVTSREYFLKVLEENSKNDNAIPFIYVTHQIEEIVPSVTHVALLHDGKILAKGLKKDILTDKLLSQMFGLDVKIVWENERPWLIVR